MAILHINHKEGTQEYECVSVNPFQNPGEDLIYCSGNVVDDWRRANEFLKDHGYPPFLIMLSSDVDDFLMSGDKYGYDEATGLIYERKP